MLALLQTGTPTAADVERKVLMRVDQWCWGKVHVYYGIHSRYRAVKAVCEISQCQGCRDKPFCRFNDIGGSSDFLSANHAAANRAVAAKKSLGIDIQRTFIVKFRPYSSSHKLTQPQTTSRQTANFPDVNIIYLVRTEGTFRLQKSITNFRDRILPAPWSLSGRQANNHNRRQR